MGLMAYTCKQYAILMIYTLEISFRHSFSILWVGSHVHTRVAGSGFHLPSASHTAFVNPSGTNPGSHPKNITAPSVLFMKPFIGTVG